jgi:glycosyltransferase involved in cell wall biosynthesis
VRVGVVTKYLGRPVGHGIYAASLLRAFAATTEESFEVYVPRAPQRSDWPPNVSIRTPRRPPRTRLALAEWELVGAPRRAARDGVDLIHYLYPGGPLAPVRVPLVIGVFDTIEWALPGYRRTPPERLLLRHQLRRADRVIVPSEEVAEELQRLLRLDAKRLAVVPLSGPRISDVRREKLPYLLFVGGTERRKNLRAVLSAFATAQLGELRLKIVGASEGGRQFERRGELESLIPADRLARVEWLGQVDESDLRRLYAEATAVVYPSRAEGFGYPVLEAAAARTPVIASRVPAIAEGFEDAVLPVDPNDVAALRAQLERVASDAALRERLVGRGVEFAASYSWARTAELTLQIYRDLLA